MGLPKQYAWLANEGGPRILNEMLAIYGTIEAPGKKNNPLILQWAQSIGLGNIYKADSIAWCGLTMAYCAARAGWDHAPRGNALSALNWASWGNPADKPSLGDVMVFKRKGGGHVALYVGEDDTAYHIIGGNQGDRVSIERKAKTRFFAARRCPWKVDQPANVRPIRMTATGPVTTKED